MVGVLLKIQASKRPSLLREIRGVFQIFVKDLRDVEKLTFHAHHNLPYDINTDRFLINNKSIVSCITLQISTDREVKLVNTMIRFVCGYEYTHSYDKSRGSFIDLSHMFSSLLLLDAR